MLDSLQLIAINRALENRWGGRPLFRVVYSETEFEVRYCKFSVFDNSGNYLGEHEETGTFRKYQNCWHCYILEKDVQDQGAPPEIKTWNGYEIIWPFKKGDSEDPIDPNVEICMFITDRLMNPVKRTIKDYKAEAQREYDEEVQRTFEILDNERPYLATMLDNKEAIVVPHNYKKDE